MPKIAICFLADFLNLMKCPNQEIAKKHTVNHSPDYRPIINYGLIACFIFLLNISFLQAQAPKFSNEFLNIGLGARAHGMGGAQAATVGDVTSMYWNPAGLADVRVSFQFSAMHAEWFAGIGQFDYLGLAKPVKFGNNRAVLGFSGVRFGVDNIPNTLELIDSDGSINFDNITSFSAADYAFNVVYAQKLFIKGLQIGGGAKVIRRQAGTFAQAWGFGLDLGVQYKLEDHWHFGLTAHDITSTFTAWDFSFTEEERAVFELTDNNIPASSLEITVPKFTLGVAYTSEFTQKIKLLAALDMDINTDGQRNVLISSRAFNIDPRIGLELTYANIVSLRGGINNIQRVLNDNTNGADRNLILQPNAGIGLQIPQKNDGDDEQRYIRLDYAYTNWANSGGNLFSHLVSLVIDMRVRRLAKKQKT